MAEKSILLIFDMDGVLIDVTGSYREVVRRTVNLYLEDVLGIKIRDKNWLTLSDIDLIKKSGGLNNDWDLTYSILNSVLVRYFDKENIDLKETFLKVSRIENEDEILKVINRYKPYFKTGLIEKAISEINLSKVFNPSDLKLEKSPFLINEGDVQTGNLIKRIFQELYMGDSLFYGIYRVKPVFNKDKGLIDNEVLIPEVEQIQRLSDLALLSIATGRPKVEAEYALKKYSIERFFYPIVTEDDIEAASAERRMQLRKPHPFIINECIKRIDSISKDKVIYIGDMPDDIKAAKRAGVIPVGFVYNKNKLDRESKEHIALLENEGAESIAFGFDDLIKIAVHL